MTYPVKWYDSGMPSAPPIVGNAAGTVIAVLDACLMNGFGSRTLNGLSVASGLATATISAGHTFKQHSVIEIAGASPAGLNGEHRILSADTTTFTFDAAGVADGTATGTITAKLPPVGSWQKALSGTDKAVYQSGDLQSTGMLYRWHDYLTGSGYEWSKVTGYESMSDIDNGVNPFPNHYALFHRSEISNATQHPWRLFADGCAVYLFVKSNNANTAWWGRVFFGDILSFRPGDAYHALCFAHPSAGGESRFALCEGSISAVDGLCRAYTQLGTAVSFSKRTWGGISLAGDSRYTYPQPIGQPLLMTPIYIEEQSNQVIRGRLPGAYALQHTLGSVADGTFHDLVEGLPGRKVLVQHCWYSPRTDYAFGFDLTGPWR